MPMLFAFPGLLSPGRSRRSVVLFATLALAACGGSPTGQVVAQVNGKEITERAIDAELATAHAEPGPAAKALIPAALDRVVTREVLVQQARRAGLDKSPDFLAMQQRADDIVLAEMMTRKLAAALPAPSQQDIDGYVAANPFRFARRAYLQTDTIEVPGGAIKPRDLVPLHSIDAVEGLLHDRHLSYQRLIQAVDTALIPTSLARQLSSVPAGEPVVLPRSEGLQVIAVRRVDPAPLPDQTARALAADALRQTAVAQQVKTLREGSKIEYRKDFGPGKPGTSGPAGSTAN